MRLMDEQYTKTPFYGARRMMAMLRQKGHQVNIKRVRRLFHLMGIEAVYPKRNISKPHPDHLIYPYLLKGLDVLHPNHVWSTDITYVRLIHGFVYLMAVIDWFSRYVLDWAVSINLEADFCIETMKRILERGNRCDIFNSDQGSQFTTPRFTEPLLGAGIQISMDGRGRVFDNIFVERLWRTVKYEDIYLKDYSTVDEVKRGLDSYFRFYNHERFHQSLDYRTPYDVYMNGGRT